MDRHSKILAKAVRVSMLYAHILSRKVEVAWGPNGAPLGPPSRSRQWGVRRKLGAGGGRDRVRLQVRLRRSFCSYWVVSLGPGWRWCGRVTARRQILRRSGDAALGQTHVARAVEVEVYHWGVRRVIRRGFVSFTLFIHRPAVGLRRLEQRIRPIRATFDRSKLI